VRFWWVNQKQTYQHEVPGGYLWSPKRKSNGAHNPFYEYMREVSPGDIVFSYADGSIKAIGIIRSHGYTSPKPASFGAAGAYWDQPVRRA
jgi:putative restriction endonuclease